MLLCTSMFVILVRFYFCEFTYISLNMESLLFCLRSGPVKQTLKPEHAAGVQVPVLHFELAGHLVSIGLAVNFEEYEVVFFLFQDDDSVS